MLSTVLCTRNTKITFVKPSKQCSAKKLNCQRELADYELAVYESNHHPVANIRTLWYNRKLAANRAEARNSQQSQYGNTVNKRTEQTKQNKERYSKLKLSLIRSKKTAAPHQSAILPMNEFNYGR